MSFQEPLLQGAERRAEWNRDNRAYKAEWEKENRLPRRRTKQRPFAGFDGEGWTVRGKHRLYLLRAGESELYTGEPLDVWEVFEWMIDLPRDVYYVGFSIGYDLTMILRGLPRERFMKLYDRSTRTFGEKKVLPLDWGPFRLDWIPGKRFSVWSREDPSKRFNVEDVIGCFQQSFATAIEHWKIPTKAEQAFIESMKAERSDFAKVASTPEGLERLKRYNTLECRLLAKMMERVREACHNEDIRPTSWFGAGQLAQALLRKHDAKQYMNTFSDSFMTHAEEAYYGGFFDVSSVGYFDSLYEYDICSAYPHAMRTLPCLAHATLVHGEAEGRRLYRVQWKPRGEPSWGAFPLRHARGEKMLREKPSTFLEGLAAPSFTPGTLYYPTHGKGWYWDAEVDSVIQSRDRDYEVSHLDCWTLQSHCDCRPFEWVSELYDYRKKLGKSGQGMVLKLGINSLYGKLAQSIGRPQFANIILAGMITSKTRSMIHEAIGKAGAENVVMVATDAVYTHKPIEGLDIGEGLGQWEGKAYGRYVVIVPGLHYSLDKEKVKTRGIPARVIREGLQRIEDHWYSDKRWESLHFPLESFVSCQNAYHIGRPELAGEWVTMPRAIHFGTMDKRMIPLDLLVGDRVRLPLWANTEHLPTGHRSEWGYMQQLRRAAQRETGDLDFDSLGDAQPDYRDPLALWD